MRRDSTIAIQDDEKQAEALSLSNASQSFHQTSTLTIQSLKVEIEAELAASGDNTAYDRKCRVLNRAVQDMGMGCYQWELFILCGFGWLADNLWLQAVALTCLP